MKRIIASLIIPVLLASACGFGDSGDAGPVTLPPTDSTTSTTTTQAGAATTTTTQPTDDGVIEVVEVVDQTFVRLFFVRDGGSADSVIRAVDEPDVAANAIRSLIEGPTAREAAAGFSTAIPTDTLLLNLTIDDGLAIVDLSLEFEVGGGSFNILSRLAQIVYTLTDFQTVDEVRFHLDGEAVDVFSGEGVVLEHPVDRSDYITILPLAQDPDTTAANPWSQADLPDIAGVDPSLLGQVTNVAADDVLNVRQDPGVTAPIVGMLLPGVVVQRTGQEQTVGTSLWVQIETPAGQFWVNDGFLTAP